MSHKLFEQLLKNRGLTDTVLRQAFLAPKYESLADPLLLPDMEKAIQRLKVAHAKNQKVVIYGDYDIDGLSATTLLLDAFEKFGFDVTTFIPSRFDDGYGLSSAALEKLVENGAELVVTVDCGSLSFEEIDFAKTIGLDIIVTDHHNVGDTLPKAIAVINPKRQDHNYPFRDFAGVGVAFSLVRAMQKNFEGLPDGQEKWLLDLVALGTVCDIVSLQDENRILAFWGLKVLQQTHRPGLKALMAVARIKPSEIDAKGLGFGLGPRLNASGRLETARHSLDLLVAQDNAEALRLAESLDAMNQIRRKEQNTIYGAALEQAEKYKKDPVLVLHHTDWSHGIIGIVAAKILEKHHKPTFVLQEIGEEAKGSARSFGDFSVGDAIRESEEHIIKGGGHKLAAGVTLATSKINSFRTSVNDYYYSLKLQDQIGHLLPKHDLVIADLKEVDEELIQLIAQLEPFGNKNTQPVFKIENLKVIDMRKMGDLKQHVKIRFADSTQKTIEFIAFSAPEHFFVNVGDRASVWVTLDINEWQGRRSIEGRLLEVDTFK